MFRILLSFALAAVFAVERAPAQFAAFQPFGQGCTVSGLPMPTIGATGLPQVGTTFSIDFTGPNRATWPTELHPVFMFGLSTANFPLDGLFNSQPAGCTLYLVPEMFLLMGPGTGIGYATSVSLPVPNNFALVGFSFVAQWCVLSQTCLIGAPCNVNAVLTSDAATITVGI